MHKGLFMCGERGRRRQGRRTSSRNSARVRGSLRKVPSMHDVISCPPGFCTPLISMHRWRASTTTPTPLGATESLRASAIASSPTQPGHCANLFVP